MLWSDSRGMCALGPAHRPEGPMNTYGWLLLGQTVLALLALGMGGGWALCAFRRSERPYLWLAAPLAGVLTLGGALALLYFFTGLSLRQSLWIGWGLNVLGTVVTVARTRTVPRARYLAAGGVVALAVSYWATVSCNKTAIDAREPTLITVDGSDMFGYAIVGDWVRAHPAADGPQPTEVLNGLTYGNLRRECSRPIAFLLLAAGAETRGTTTLFSYDWVSGVLLAAGLAGFAGASAGNVPILVLVAAGGAASSWLTDNRTGYLGKAIAYPAGVLLVSLMLTALTEPSRARWAVTILFGTVLAWCLSPMFPPVLLAIAAGGYLVTLVALFIRGRWDEHSNGFGTAVIRPAVAALVLSAASSVPMFVTYRLMFGSFPPPPPPTDWSWVLPVSLDLELPTLKAVTVISWVWLMRAAAAAIAVALAAALWRGQRAASALLACGLFVPFAWALDEFRLYTFHGLVFPLTLAGAAALADPRSKVAAVPSVEGPSTGGAGVVRIALVALLVCGTVGLRVPQFRAAASRYVYAPPSHRVVHRQSEAVALRAALEHAPLDVALGHYADNHFVWAELATREVPVRFRSPGWNVSVGAYAGPSPNYDLFAPKASFALLERGAWSAPGTERWVGKRLKLVQDQKAIAVVGVYAGQANSWDGEWRPGVWIGNAPTTLLIHNGADHVCAVRLTADTAAGPAHPDPNRRTLRYRLRDRASTLSLPKTNRAVLSLLLEPGMNRIELSVEEQAEPLAPAGHPVPLLEFRNWCIETAGGP